MFSSYMMILNLFDLV